MDARRPATAHWLGEWRVHTLERHGFQFRDDHVGKSLHTPKVRIYLLTGYVQAHEGPIREASWSHSGDWLVSGDANGSLKYWQPNFNMVNAFVAHESSIRGIAFCPNDSKFVTASDDTTLKVWDFSRGVAEATLTGHGWDAKSVDWHPTKGLLVSGSKDHQVKLWDPRNGRCLTTLHGHKNTLTKTLFEPKKGLLLATAARDQTARVFDLRMMRDVLLLRGHEKDIMSLTWHPVHASLLSTGGFDGCLHHYLLDEPNSADSTASTSTPATPATLSVYDSPDPATAPAQTIYPAHRVPHAHELAIWSLDWHPLGHILATGSNDRVTRFWGRPRPGDTDCYRDRYHLGDAAAEAHGTWSSRKARQAARDEEEREEEDEAEGLVDQKIPGRSAPGMSMPGLPGLPGIAASLAQPPRDGTSTGGAQLPAGLHLPGMSGTVAPPLPLPPFPPGQNGVVPNISQLAEMFGGQLPPPIPPPGYAGFPPPPGALPPGFALPGFVGQGQGQVALAGEGDAGVRRRAPLPSQQDSLREEMQRGRYRAPR